MPEKWDRESHKKANEIFFVHVRVEGGGRLKNTLDLPEVTEYVQGGKMKGKTEMKKKRRHLITK